MHHKVIRPRAEPHIAADFNGNASVRLRKATRGGWSARIRRRRGFVEALFRRCIRAGVWALLGCQARDFGVQQSHRVFRIIDGYREYLAIM